MGEIGGEWNWGAGCEIPQRLNIYVEKERKRTPTERVLGTEPQSWRQLDVLTGEHVGTSFWSPRGQAGKEFANSAKDY